MTAPGKRAFTRATITDQQSELEARAQFLAEQAVSYAMNAKESWFPDGHLDYDMFAGLLADALVQSIFKPILNY